MNLFTLISINFAIVAMFAFVNALLTYFLQFCFRQGAIFTNWLPFVASLCVRYNDRKTYDNIKGMPAVLQENEFIKEGQNSFLYKILGGCHICQNVWQSFATFWPVYFLCEVQIWWGLPYILISNFILRKIWNDEKD